MKSFSGNYAVYANDWAGNVIDVSADDVWETASCIKVPILLTLLNQIDNGEVSETLILTREDKHTVGGSGILRALSIGLQLPILDVATLMIIVSDNIATNMLIDFLGVDTINSFMKSLGLKHTKLLHEIDFEKYDDLGQTTAREYGSLFERIHDKSLFSESISNKAIEILSKQHYNTLMTKGLPQWLLDSENTNDEEIIKVISKSGSLDNCRNDGGVIYTPYGDFVSVVFTKDFSDKVYHNNHESYRFGPRISRLLFDQYIALEGKFKK